MKSAEDAALEHLSAFHQRRGSIAMHGPHALILWAPQQVMQTYRKALEDYRHQLACQDCLDLGIPTKLPPGWMSVTLPLKP